MKLTQSQVKALEDEKKTRIDKIVESAESTYGDVGEEQDKAKFIQKGTSKTEKWYMEEVGKLDKPDMGVWQ